MKNSKAYIMLVCIMAMLAGTVLPGVSVVNADENDSEYTADIDCVTVSDGDRTSKDYIYFTVGKDDKYADGIESLETEIKNSDGETIVNGTGETDTSKKNYIIILDLNKESYGEEENFDKAKQLTKKIYEEWNSYNDSVKKMYVVGKEHSAASSDGGQYDSRELSTVDDIDKLEWVEEQPDEIEKQIWEIVKNRKDQHNDCDAYIVVSGGIPDDIISKEFDDGKESYPVTDLAKSTSPAVFEYADMKNEKAYWLKYGDNYEDAKSELTKETVESSDDNKVFDLLKAFNENLYWTTYSENDAKDAETFNVDITNEGGEEVVAWIEYPEKKTEGGERSTTEQTTKEPTTEPPSGTTDNPTVKNKGNKVVVTYECQEGQSKDNVKIKDSSGEYNPSGAIEVDDEGGELTFTIYNKQLDNNVATDSDATEYDYSLVVKDGMGDGLDLTLCAFTVKDSLKSPVDYIKDHLIAFIIILAVAVFLIVFLVILLATRGRRKKKGGRSGLYKGGASTIPNTGAVSPMAETRVLARRAGQGADGQQVPTNNIRIIQLQIVGRNPRLMNNVTVEGSAFVGRSSQCEIFINDACVSKQHFVFECVNGDMFIRPLVASNGVKLNGERIYDRRRLQPNDRIIIGRVGIIVRW